MLLPNLQLSHMLTMTGGKDIPPLQDVPAGSRKRMEAHMP